MTITELPADTESTRYNTQWQPINWFGNLDAWLRAVWGSIASRGNDFAPTTEVLESMHARVIRTLPGGYLFDKDGRSTSWFEHLDRLS